MSGRFTSTFERWRGSCLFAASARRFGTRPANGSVWSDSSLNGRRPASHTDFAHPVGRRTTLTSAIYLKTALLPEAVCVPEKAERDRFEQRLDGRRLFDEGFVFPQDVSFLE